MVNPVPGRSVTTAYRKVSSGSWQACGFHTGQDYAAPHGTPVVAARAGRLERVNAGASFGSDQLLVKVSGGGGDFYAHLLRVTGAVPRDVAAGEQIGEVGSDGNATGPHLHFERWAETGGGWPSCNGFQDPMLSHNAGGGGSPWAAGDVWREKLTYGQMDSDSVKRLAYRLNALGLVEGEPLPYTGNYLRRTDAAVRRWQESIGNAPDPVGASFLGPLQTARMFPVPPYRIR